MIDIRVFDKLGRLRNDWRGAHYHFSFSQYYDLARVRHGALRVWNDDETGPRTGFAPHGHEPVEIITYVRKGAVTHKGSLGNTGRTEAGDVQVMSAGSGIPQSEWNAEDVKTELFRLWILPRNRGGKQGWGARKFPKSDRSGNRAVLASGSGEGESLTIIEDTRVLGAAIKAGETLTYTLPGGRSGYLVAADGKVTLNGQRLAARGGGAITGGETLTLDAAVSAERALVDTV
ncbi:MAG: pirin family protein [Hyphomonas sp.]|uniref:pirin family protein n=1 Tax=Hyphomonas sp. TaxID=87 RepID=UPI0034A081E0